MLYGANVCFPQLIKTYTVTASRSTTIHNTVVNLFYILPLVSESFNCKSLFCTSISVGKTQNILNSVVTQYCTKNQILHNKNHSIIVCTLKHKNSEIKVYFTSLPEVHRKVFPFLALS